MGPICVVAQALFNDCCGKKAKSSFRPLCWLLNTAAEFAALHKYKYSVQVREDV